MQSFASSGSVAGNSTTSGSSAAVLEFVCLFTHDLKRKQKRWQDGRLKYHTFNKRVMVHDERGNYVGDMHWHRDWDLDEGEEIELERGGVIVQVAECVGSRNQDLSELLDKRAKEKEERQLKAASRPSLLRPPIQNTPLHRVVAPQDNFQTRHRPLHQVIGTPTGHHGRALVPTESPFEQRQQAADTPESRAPKKRRCDDTPPSRLGYAQSLFGAPLTLSAIPMSSAPRRPPASHRQRGPSSSPPEDQGRRNGVDSFQEAPDVSLSRMEGHRPEGLPSQSPPTVRCSRERRPDETAKSRSNAGGNLQKEKENNNATGPQYGPYLHLNEPISRNTTPLTRPPKPNLDPTGQRHTAQQTRTHRGDTRVETSTVTEPECIILDDDMGSLPRINIEAPTAVAAVAAAAAAAPKSTRPLARKSLQNAKRKKTPPLESPALPRQAADDALSPVATDPSREEDKEPNDKENRTKLRLRPRKKRGLLLASEHLKPDKRLQIPKEASKTPATGSQDSVEVGKKSATSRMISRKDTSPPAGEDDPFASLPRAPGRDLETDQRRFSRRSSEDLGTGSRADSDPAGDIHQPDEHDDPFASSPVIEREAETSKHPFNSPPSPKGFEETAETHGARLTRPRTRKGLAHDESAEKRRRGPAETTYDIPEDTDDEYFGTLPTPLPPRRQTPKVVACRSADLQANMSSSVGRPTGTRNDSSDQQRSSAESPVAAERSSKRRLSDVGEPETSDEEFPQPRRLRPGRVRLVNEEYPQVPIGPRLARLGRNVKSKEVFGYLSQSSPFEQQPNPQNPASIQSSPETAAGTLSLVRRTPSPDPVARQSTFGAVGTSSRDPGAGVLAAAVTDSAAAPLTASGLLRRQNSLPEVAHHESSPDENPRRDQPTAGTKNTRASILRSVQTPPIAPRDNGETSGVSESLITTAAVNKPFNLVGSDSVSLPATHQYLAKKANLSAADGNGTHLSPRQSNDLPQDRLKPVDATCSTHQPISAVDGRAGGAGSDEATATVPSKRPRIANPASRGRKAALKSHAAGQVPQSILPPAGPVPARLMETRQEPAANERPKRKMTFPGFMSARAGGPWSREAHDLLEKGRPSS